MNGRTDLSWRCVSEDYDNITDAWIVVCTIVGPRNTVDLHVAVDDVTGLATWQ